jgi:hypothetical protein
LGVRVFNRNPPPSAVGFDSVHGDATKHPKLNYDEFVMYTEDAVLPFVVVEYKFI